MPDNIDDAFQPLLQEDRQAASSNACDRSAEDSDPRTSCFITLYNKFREQLQDFLSSRYQHYCVLGLVSLDLLGIFADIFINLYTCEQDDNDPRWGDARGGLAIAGLVFSCLFMVELLMSVWAFGWKYFSSWFHSFDATVIVAGFVVDVLLHGILEEVASLVVILRLWRFFKIIEEFTVGAQEQMDGLELRLEQLESENEDLKRDLRKRKGIDEEEEVGFHSGSGSG